MKKDVIQLSDHFSYGRLIRFILPSIITMIFTSFYGVVDGLCVSNFAGENAFAAVNLIMPFPMLLGAFGMMFGTGGSALTALKFGEGKPEEANKTFSQMVYATALLGIAFAIAGVVFTRPLALLVGADGEILEYCTIYGRIMFIGVPFFMLQTLFQSFMVTAEKPSIGLLITILAGVTNIILDIVFVGLFQGGVTGAAIATLISQMVGSIVPFVYFLRENDSILGLVRTGFSLPLIWKACFNGSSELMTNASLSLVNILYNYQLMKFLGYDGVAAYGVIMYVNFIFVSTFVGYSYGGAPIVSYHYGAGNKEELQNVHGKSLKIIGITGVVMTLLAVLSSGLLSGIFVGYNEALRELTARGFIIYSMSFLVMGFNIYGSSFFTALGNGVVSAVISFLRTFAFQVIMLLVLPLLFEADGIWSSIVVSEILAIVITLVIMLKMAPKYGYFKYACK